MDDDLIFSVDERVGDVSVSPEHAPLLLIAEFAREVEQFLRGSSKSSEPRMVSIVPGSLGLRPIDAPDYPEWAGDLALLQREDALGLIDPVRRRIVEKWQARARARPGRVYCIRDDANKRVVRITKDTCYRSVEAAAWVKVDRYLVGEVEDIGGSREPNMHLRVDDKKIVVSATVEALRQLEDNLLYKKCLVHVIAEENLSSGELRNVCLVEANRFTPAFNEAEYELARRRGAIAWVGAGDAVEWVRSIREG